MVVNQKHFSMKLVVILVFILSSFNGLSQVAIGIEAGHTFNVLNDAFKVGEPSVGGQVLLFNAVNLSYSNLNTISLGVLPIAKNKSSRGLARTCRNYNSNGFSYGLEGSYSFEESRGGVGLLFAYKIGKSNILTAKVNTLQGIRVGYMYSL